MGVLQGLIVRPFLFLIYINNLTYASDMYSIIMYADDTTLFCNFDNVCSENKINSELHNIFNWLCSTKLSLSVSKSKFACCFHTKQKRIAYPDLKNNTINIDRVPEINFLGLIMYLALCVFKTNSARRNFAYLISIISIHTFISDIKSPYTIKYTYN